MPARHVIDVENHIVLTTFLGSITVRDFAEHYARLVADPLFDASFSELAEFHESSDVRRQLRVKLPAAPLPCLIPQIEARAGGNCRLCPLPRFEER